MVYCYGDTSGAKEKIGHYEVWIAIEGSILEEIGGKSTVDKCISNRLMKARLELQCKPSGNPFVITHSPA